MDLVIPDKPHHEKAQPSASAAVDPPPLPDVAKQGTQNNVTPPATSATADPTPADRSKAFVAVEGAPELVSGEKLLVEAYSAIWIVLFGMLLFSWRRQKLLDERVHHLATELQRARASGPSSRRKLGDDGDAPLPPKAAPEAVAKAADPKPPKATASEVSEKSGET